ncbi:MAG: site-specific integrase [Nakamurella sp.]
MVDDGGREHTRAFDRKIDAQRWVDDQVAGLVTGTHVAPSAGRITFAHWWRVWSSRQVWTPGTVEAADQAARSVTFGSVLLADLRPSHLQAWVKSMTLPAPSRSGSLAASTIRTRTNYVGMALRAAVGDRLISRDPAAKLRLPATRKAAAAMTIPTPEQVREAIGAAPDWFRPFVQVCAFAGLRLGEAAGLQLGDIDFLRRTISIRRQLQGTNVATTTVEAPKYESERVLYVADELLTALAEHVRGIGTRGPERWLFFSGSDLLNRNSAGNQWRRIREAAGWGEPFTLHDLRHFYASGLIAAGCDVVTVQRALGHSSATVTLSTYAHLWPTAEDRTRVASAGLMAAVNGSAADQLRTEAVSGAFDLR